MNCNRYLQIGIDLSQRQLLRLTVSDITNKNSKKILLSERINLTEEESNSLLTNCEEVAEELNNFFANAVKNLHILNYENCNSWAENIDNPTLKAIAKWRNQPSILVIASEYKNRETFLSILFLKKTFLQ